MQIGLDLQVCSFFTRATDTYPDYPLRNKKDRFDLVHKEHARQPLSMPFIESIVSQAYMSWVRTLLAY